MDIFKKDCRELEHLYDARIHTEDGREFQVHRVLLAMESTYFKEVFLQSSTSHIILVPEINGSTMQTVINYIYTGKVNINEENIKQIFEAAHFLGINKLLIMSNYEALKNLSPTNSVAMLKAGYEMNKLGIMKGCSRYIEVNFQKLINVNSRFEDLTVEYFRQLLNSDSLNVSSEYQVWRAIELWVGKFPEQRKKWFKNLIESIRFCNCDSNLHLQVLEHPFVKEDSSCVQLVEDVASRYQCHRVPKKSFLVTKLINRLDNATGIDIFITYDGALDFWRHITSTLFCPDVILCTGSLVMAFETTRNNIYAFDILSKTWTTRSTPNIPSPYKVVKSGSEIFALGVATHGEIMMNIERYDVDSEMWELVITHHSITDGAAVDIEGKIYIIGTIAGISREFLVARVYDTSIPEDLILNINAPKVYRRNFALIVYKENIFILGGQRNDNYVKSVEMYDPEKNVWIQLEDLPFPYISPKGVVIEDKLHVYSNNLLPSNYPPAFWNEVSLSWQIVEPSSPLYDVPIYQFATIDDATVILELRNENTDPVTKWEPSPFYFYQNL